MVIRKARRKTVEDGEGNESKSHHHPESFLRMSVSLRESASSLLERKSTKAVYDHDGTGACMEN